MNNKISYNCKALLDWINKNFSDIGNVTENEFNTECKRRKVLIQCIKSYINTVSDNSETKLTINGNITSSLSDKIKQYMTIDYVLNTKPTVSVYMLKSCLISMGYDCDFNGEYNKSTMNIVKKYKLANNIEMGKYPYIITDDIWYNLLTGKHKEDK